VTIRNALPIFVAALPLCACGQERPQPIPVAPARLECPRFPAPPEDLMQPPAILDFLSSSGSSPPSRR
jgi:hypothetical protein